jgi:hypothetical protein
MIDPYGFILGIGLLASISSVLVMLAIVVAIWPRRRTA